MLQGFYKAASGLVTQQKMLNASAANIANAGTVGYKKDHLVAGNFGEHLAVRLNSYQGGLPQELGLSSYMQVVDSAYTDFTQGGFSQTGRSLDFALQGPGFFVVENNQGELCLTRSGQFTRDDEGYLELPGYGRVLGEDGFLWLEDVEFSAAPGGQLYRVDEDGEGEVLGRLLIVLPEEDSGIEKNQEGLFLTGEYYQAGEETGTTVLQGVLERSNVDMAQEMTRVIASQRSLQSCSQLVKMYDEIADQINTRIAKL